MLPFVTFASTFGARHFDFYQFLIWFCAREIPFCSTDCRKWQTWQIQWLNKIASNAHWALCTGTHMHGLHIASKRNTILGYFHVNGKRKFGEHKRIYGRVCRLSALFGRISLEFRSSVEKEYPCDLFRPSFSDFCFLRTSAALSPSPFRFHFVLSAYFVTTVESHTTSFRKRIHSCFSFYFSVFVGSNVRLDSRIHSDLITKNCCFLENRRLRYEAGRKPHEHRHRRQCRRRWWW